MTMPRWREYRATWRVLSTGTAFGATVQAASSTQLRHRRAQHASLARPYMAPQAGSLADQRLRPVWHRSEAICRNFPA